MPLNSEARIVQSSVTGCETRLRSRNPCQEAVPLALGKWRGAEVDLGVQSKATGPEVDSPVQRPLRSRSQAGGPGSTARSRGPKCRQ